MKKRFSTGILPKINLILTGQYGAPASLEQVVPQNHLMEAGPQVIK